MAVYGMEQRMDDVSGAVTSSTPCKPTSEYGISKLRAEEYLRLLESELFAISVVRVPSIFGRGKTEYLDQFKYLADKLPVIPIAFQNLHKSMIYIDNFCELIHLIIKKCYSGVVCPDEGEISTVDICRAIYPNRKTSVVIGKLMEIILKNNERIRDYYGAIHYDTHMSNVFNAEYRVVPFREAVKISYE
jgi:UDP-glucose 4-epimerase